MKTQIQSVTSTAKFLSLELYVNNKIFTRVKDRIQIRVVFREWDDSFPNFKCHISAMMMNQICICKNNGTNKHFDHFNSNISVSCLC